MNTTNIATAQREYYSRPADERFATLADLVRVAQADRQASAERTYNLRDLRAVPQGADLHLESPKGRASLTHWAFGQLARTIGAPANYLRTLPPAIAADAINHGLHEAAPVGTTANLLVRDDPASTEPIIRACTSETYGRVWDAQLYGELSRWFGDGVKSAGGEWQTPPAWPGSPASGQYRGDRDSFVIRTEGGSIVTDPSTASGDGGRLYRGLLVRNSEVGHCSITVECILFRYICGNHMLWGAVMDRQFRRRHVGNKVTRDTIQELLTLARKFNTRTASQDEQIIRALVEHEIAQTEEGVIDELRKLNMSKADAQEAYTRAVETETASPRSYWGIAQGITRISQDSGYQDERIALDQIAAQVIKRGAVAYATV